MNKFLKFSLFIKFILCFGFFSSLLSYYLKYSIVSIALLAITIALVVILTFFQLINLENYKKEYFLKSDIDDKQEVEKYKKESMITEICNIICNPFIIIDVTLAYVNFGNNIFSDTDNKEIIYIILIILLTALVIKSIIDSIKKIVSLNTIEIDLKNENFETIYEKPKMINPLYYLNFTRNGRLKIGCGLEIIFDDGLKLIAIINFPFPGKRKMDEFIQDYLMNKKYKLKYLKKSKIILEIDSKIINAFKMD